MRSLYIQYKCCKSVLRRADDIQCVIWLYAIILNLVLSESFKITRLLSVSTLHYPLALMWQLNTHQENFLWEKWSHAIHCHGDMLHFTGLHRLFACCCTQKCPHTLRHHWTCSSDEWIPTKSAFNNAAIHEHSRFKAIDLYFTFFKERTLDRIPDFRHICATWASKSVAKKTENHFEGLLSV